MDRIMNPDELVINLKGVISWCKNYELHPGPWFNIKMSSCQYRKSHCEDKTLVRSSYFHNEISYTGKMASFYYTPPHNEDVGGYIGFALSVRPSIPLFVLPSRIPFPLCSAYRCDWIHFIFIDLIKQLQRVFHIYSLLQILKFEFLAIF